jgi:hypothetical protein
MTRERKMKSVNESSSLQKIPAFRKARLTLSFYEIDVWQFEAHDETWSH